MIANCNAILVHCGDGNPVLSDTYYRLVKGEVLGLRAMMHLDLFTYVRTYLFGRKQGNKMYPYMTERRIGACSRCCLPIV